MAKIFRPSNRESKILSQIESSKERFRRMALSGIRDCLEPLSNSIAMKLVESELVETTNKNELEDQPQPEGGHRDAGDRDQARTVIQRLALLCAREHSERKANHEGNEHTGQH